ncbi:MAG: SH3 domain-containing protein, partial [Burkholderiales bacterium]|nr:SH3 domain-containing protein [Anaerolineae bacterium]
MPGIQYGINLNGHPHAAFGRPANARELNGLAWVRMVFLLHAAVVSDHDHTNIFGYDLNRPLEYADALQRAYAHYDALIRSYAEHGIRTLLILNQETFAGNAPWHPGSDGNWQRFAQDFGAICGKIAAHYRDFTVDYEIWNEGDMPGAHSSVFIDASNFAPVLSAAAASIYNSSPDAKVIFGGLVNGAVPAAQYVNKVRQQLGGQLPVDGVGVHPYGQRLSNQPNIPGNWPGRLDQDTLKVFDNALPEKLWITEIGISEPGVITSAHYAEIASYMRGAFNLIETKYVDSIPVVIWFGWSDVMREAGITDAQGRPKAHIYDTFFELARNGARADAPIVNAPYRLQLEPTASQLNVREPDGTKFHQLTSVTQGDLLTVVERPELAIAKMGKPDQWIHVRTLDTTEGWVNAALVEPTTECANVIDAGNAPVPFMLVPKAANVSIYDGSLTMLPKRRDANGPIVIERGEQVAVVEDPQIAFEKVRLGALEDGSSENHWVHIRTANGVEGWSAAWYLTVGDGSQIPDALPVRTAVHIRPEPVDNDEDGSADTEQPASIRDAVDAIRQYYDLEVTLDSVDQYSAMVQIITDLVDYGVVLRNSHQGSAPWTLAEAESIHSVVVQSANQTALIFDELYGVDNPKMAFRALYAPLAVARDGRQSVAPRPDETWFAKNSFGYDVFFGNRSFFAGEKQTTVLASTQRRFTTERLMAHEIAHTLNWRYNLLDPDSGQFSSIDSYFANKVETADGLGENAGLVFGAQSSKQSYETVTDAIACFNFDGLTADANGSTRRTQLKALMKLIAQYRVQEFSQSDLSSAITSLNNGSSPGLVQRVSAVNSVAQVEEMRHWLSSLRPVSGGFAPMFRNGGTRIGFVPALLDIDTDFINLRSGPGLEFDPPIARLTDRSLVEWNQNSSVIDQRNNFEWVEVASVQLNGWIAKRGNKVRLVDPAHFAEAELPSNTFTNVVLDVSHWQNVTDWQAVFDDGIRAIIHK